MDIFNCHFLKKILKLDLAFSWVSEPIVLFLLLWNSYLFLEVANKRVMLTFHDIQNNTILFFK